jgi:hypothetical protein
MDSTVKKDLLSILTDTISILKTKDTTSLKELSNHTIHNASIFQDQDSLSIAVIIYSISKILDRGHHDTRQIITLMEQAIMKLNHDDDNGYRAVTKKLLTLITNVDTRLKLFIEEVVHQAEIKKGTKIYDHGISLGQASALLGVSQWEMMNYIGKTQIQEAPFSRPDVIEKIKFTRSLFA